ncbi:amino acid adenylation domain-containing protein [Streptomyces sp. NPDC050803]|uniref:amino acid adenylation domain-containing protein n=1 Tax=unclassified Streptomyces TaxID=2593676 RepID=UPI0034206CA5
MRDTTRPKSTSLCLSDLLHRQARLFPDETAVVFRDQRLTRRELVEQASRLAALLRTLGTASDDRVGVFAEPSLDLMTGVWGVVLSGGAYVPLSPEYPEERLRYMIEDAGLDVVVAQRGLTDRLRELAPRGTRVVTLNDVPDEPEEPTPHHPSALAYVIYTSGSTGRPKGVMIEQHSIVSQLRWLRAAHGLRRGKVVLQKTPMSFDAAQWEILAPALGARVVVADPGTYRDPEGLIRAVREHGVTTLQCVPTLLRALLDTEDLPRCTSLTQVFSGGEALSVPLARDLLAALPEAALTNLYGPTECTINASAHTVGPEDLTDPGQSVPIGTPVRGTRFHVLDKHLAPVADGEVGELYVSGVQLARGYLHRPELTAEKFVPNPFTNEPAHSRLYRTGDLVSRTDTGAVRFAGRTDNQVKLRGFRVELDEIRTAIEAHDWVRNAAVVVKRDSRTGFQNLVSFVELNAKEAALMDQGSHGSHHQSKESRLQVRAQLSGAGFRDEAELAGLPVTDLPGRTPTDRQRQLVFARKTYRYFDGGETTAADLLALLGRRAAAAPSRAPEDLTLAELGEILRYFGQFLSPERLLPKYGYASPGALYATQMYIEGIPGLAPGCHYYHPARHQLIRVAEATDVTDPTATRPPRIHFVGKRSAIEPVYKNNIQEVLEIETGHMVGLFEEILPAHGLGIVGTGRTPGIKDHLACAKEDYGLGTFELVPYTEARDSAGIDLYVQAHPGKVADLPAGQYRYHAGDLERISDDLVLKRHVIAINQQVYDRSAVGITAMVRGDTHPDWRAYVDLGRTLQRLQMNDLGLGFMSSGYSSRSGHALPAARRMADILAECGMPSGPSYFFVGGRISEEQRRSEGMYEDRVHMKGPAEMIKEDLLGLLPDYMVPNRVVILDELPLTANGKVDLKALDSKAPTGSGRPVVPPRTGTEKRLAAIWRTALKLDDEDGVSVHDDFFECGGNSLVAVSLVHRVNEEFGSSLPLQVLFEAPTVERLAHAVDDESGRHSSRLVRLAGGAAGTPPVFCWPGLGGYPMNLRLLAERMDPDRLFYGVQAHGINAGEEPYPTIAEMAAADVAEIRRRQPEGPYTLWGYSFGARVAFEAALLLERSGERVEELFLIAPGSPKAKRAHPGAGGIGHQPGTDRPAYDNEDFVRILFSVFTGRITGPALVECLRAARDERSFTGFIRSLLPALDEGTVHRVIGVVRRTYELNYTFPELAKGRIDAPVTVFKARGDDYSFLESSGGFSAEPPTVVPLEADHYGLLREPGVDEVVRAIHGHVRVMSGCDRK